MKILVENWYLLVAGIVCVLAGVYAVVAFTKKPTEEQIRTVKEWLLWAVTDAERHLGAGTGRLKLRMVYDMFISKFPELKEIITFDMISVMVDEALEDMRVMLTTNKLIREYVDSPLEMSREEKK